eukprot:26343-Pelagococcus_subviridis.AAC.13
MDAMSYAVTVAGKNKSFPLQNTSTRAPTASNSCTAKLAPTSACRGGGGSIGSSSAASFSLVGSHASSLGTFLLNAERSAADASARRSAPAAPSVFAATAAIVRSVGLGRQCCVCRRKIARLAAGPGREKCNSRSNRPGRRSAGSTASGRFVAATTTTLPRGFRPSMSASNVATTEPWIESELDVRAGANPSISSKKMIDGCLRSASSNSKRISRSASPWYFPRQSAPRRLKNETGRGPRAAAPSNARTAAVFPVPGGP